jgi:hypothetical protein
MKLRAVAVAVLCVVIPNGLAFAQAIQNVVLRNSFNPIGAGARGLGMGGAFLAVADDGTAASFNPAGLAQLRRTEVALVGFRDTLSSIITARGANEPADTSHHGAPDFAGLSIPFEVADRNLTVEMSYQRSVDLFGTGHATVVDTVNLRDIDIEANGTADLIARINPTQSGAFHTVSAAAGYQVTSRLSLGASLNYWISEWTALGSSSFTGRINAKGAPSTEIELAHDSFNQKQSFRAVNVNLGFLLKYPKLSIGGVYRTPFTGDYDLKETGSHTDFSNDTTRQINNNITTRLHWPRSAGIGVALRPVHGLTLAGDYTRALWSRSTIDDVPGGVLRTPVITDANGDPVATFTDRNFFDLQPTPDTFTIDTGQWRAGGEYLVVTSKLVVPLRAGLFRDTSPVAQVNGQERRIDGLTFGTGLNFSHVVLDVAYERRTSDGDVTLLLGRHSATAPPPASEKVTESRIVASLLYRFGGQGEDPLKRLFRYLFVGAKEE